MTAQGQTSTDVEAARCAESVIVDEGTGELTVGDPQCESHAQSMTKTDAAGTIRNRRNRSRDHPNLYWFLWLLYVFINFAVWPIYRFVPSKAFKNVFTVFAVLIPSILVIIFGTFWVKRIADQHCVQLQIMNIRFISVSTTFAFILLPCLVFIVAGNLAQLIPNREHMLVAYNLLIAPIIEIVVLFLMMAALNVYTGNKLDITHYFYLQISAICVGAGLAIITNFQFVSFCEWQNVSVPLGLFTMECPKEWLTVLQNTGISPAEIAFFSAMVTVPMHVTACFVMMACLCIIRGAHNYENGASYRRFYVMLLVLPLIMHLLHNISLITQAQWALYVSQIALWLCLMMFTQYVREKFVRIVISGEQ